MNPARKPKVEWMTVGQRTIPTLECPSCGTVFELEEDVYDGSRETECPNPRCDYHEKRSWREPPKKE